jgi:macrodomain Ter protein organizer (MatP/YcbG family)
LETPVKFLSRSNGRFTRYGPYEPLLLPGATRPPPHRVLIPHPLYGKGHPETPVKFRSRSNDRINSYCLYEPLLFPGATRRPPHRVSIPHPQYGKAHLETGPTETPLKFRSRSNGRIKSYCLYDPLLLPDATRPPPHQVWIPHPLNGKRASGNSRKILVTIQRLDQKLWPVRTVTLAWSDQTSSSTSIDSTSTIWKRASKNSRKILITIQRSDQKLWPLRTDTLVSRDQISSSPSIDSTFTIWKRISGNSCKI